jgi:hypothetical protein
MVIMMQVLGYFELIIYIYIVCNRVFIELRDRTARKAYHLRCIFSRCSLLSLTAREATDDYPFARESARIRQLNLFGYSR